ncbi:MAG: hypothetical protein JO236_01255 [Mycobacterium sp.]|uniref:hypothetical protein n=1 Tax=Mycobacterium sp. TaxID=1785 RepID=UPI001EB0FCA6|nr:hypothetical protein [Mycobacterium sp.]MBW0016168.1 hypothetical protein [Mycobacterium sp.]
MRGKRIALTRLALGSADASPGAPHDEFLQLFGIDEEGRIALQVSFDLEDIEAAIAELDATHERLEGQRRAPRLENAASRVVERNQALFDARDWEAMAEMLADDISTDDRRQVVGAGVRCGRNVAVQDARANAELGAKLVASTVVATRGEHLVFCRTHYSTSAEPAEKFHVDALLVYEINADERIAAALTFDPDDFDAAIAELDARYLAGEAAPHAHAWSVVAGAYAAFNRRESSTTTPDWVNIDHRRGAGFAPGDMIAYLRAAWEDSPDTKIYIATVHRLSNIGAVVTHAARGVSQGGFDAEWRDNHLLTIDGDLVNRCELFDEADLDTALARFEELSRQTRRLENAASRLYERFQAHLSTRDWDALAETVGNNSYTEDRRRVVNSGIRYDRDAVDDLRALADVGFRLTLVGVIAIRGERLALTHVRGSGQDPGAIESEALNVVESDADERFSTVVVFDLDDFDAAIAELDARYLAGEAAAHAHVWSVVTQTYAGLNRGEWPATAHDWQIVDHRQVITIPPNDMLENFRASWDLVPNLSLYIEAVHRLSDIGAVFTQAVKGTSEEGFEAEWRINNTTMFEGENINRVEMFDESDIDTAIARFEQLSQPAPRLENAASQAVERYVAHFVARDWDALAEVLADDIVIDDRRRIVNAGTRHGRETEIANLRATADAGFTYMTSVVIAGRGERLILARAAGRDDGSEEFLSEALAVVEVSSHNQIRAIVVFDIDDFEAAIAELDTRYLAGEAAAHARSWSVITEGYASLNRRELPATTTDFANIDHRRGRAFAPGDLRPYLRASWDVSPRFRIYIEAVHRLSDLGAVVTHTAYGTSSEGFEAEWREVNLLTADGDAVNQCELFDEADIDAALAKFEQLHPQMRAPENAASRTIDRFLAFAVLARFEELHRRAHRVENPASQAAQRFFASLGARNWVAMADILVDNSFSDDRRRVVNAGVWHGRDVLIAKLRETTDPGVEVEISAVSAIRGRRLALSQVRWSISEHGPEAFRSEALCITEMESDELIAAIIMFDPDDMDTALKELDARYLAGEAAPYAQTWSVIAEAHAGFNRHELPATTSDPVYIDHQPLVSVEEVDLAATLRAVWDLTPQASVYIEAVHRLSEAGAVITQALKGTSKEGFDAEWWMIDVFIVQGDLISRVEVFDEADIDAAITRFEELQPRPRRLENAATRAGDRFFTLFRARDWEAIAKALTEDSSVDDRRRVVNAGRWDRRNSVITNMQALAEGWTNLTMTVVATRGERLALTRICSSNRDLRYGNFDVEMLTIIEIDTDERIRAQVLFSLDDLDSAFAELDVRYLAGEAAALAHTWSVVAKACAALSQRGLFPTTPDWVNVDHRRGIAFKSGDLTEYIRSAWNLLSGGGIYAKTAHRLSDLGAVYSWVGYGTSQDGSDVEFHGVNLLTVEGDLVNRVEIFDETDLDAALARFEELQPKARQLENAASRVDERFAAHFAARERQAMAGLMADAISIDDRRHVVNSGLRHGRDAEVANMRARVGVGVERITSAVVATRGERLALTRSCFSGRHPRPEEFHTEALCIVEIDAEERIVGRIGYDIADINAAFEELDARYLAGEGAAHSHTWSVVADLYAGFNRRELPATTPDWTYVDNRSVISIEASDLPAFISAGWELTPEISIHMEAVHRLSDLGVVVTHTAHGISPEDFNVEWRMIDIFTVDGDLISRCEMFDETDLDAALARFEELRP